MCPDEDQASEAQRLKIELAALALIQEARRTIWRLVHDGGTCSLVLTCMQERSEECPCVPTFVAKYLSDQPPC